MADLELTDQVRGLRRVMAACIMDSANTLCAKRPLPPAEGAARSTINDYRFRWRKWCHTLAREIAWLLEEGGQFDYFCDELNVSPERVRRRIFARSDINPKARHRYHCHLRRKARRTTSREPQPPRRLVEPGSREAGLQAAEGRRERRAEAAATLQQAREIIEKRERRKREAGGPIALGIA